MNLVAAIETDRLRLAPVAAADEVALRRFFRNDHVRRYMLDGALGEDAWVANEIEASARRFRREADICALC